DTRMNTSAVSIACTPDGFSEKVWGEAVPSASSDGVPTPSINCATRECMGLIVTTTLSSAAACPADIHSSASAEVAANDERNSMTSAPPPGSKSRSPYLLSPGLYVIISDRRNLVPGRPNTQPPTFRAMTEKASFGIDAIGGSVARHLPRSGDA